MSYYDIFIPIGYSKSGRKRQRRIYKTESDQAEKTKLEKRDEMRRQNNDGLHDYNRFKFGCAG